MAAKHPDPHHTAREAREPRAVATGLASGFHILRFAFLSPVLATAFRSWVGRPAAFASLLAATFGLQMGRRKQEFFFFNLNLDGFQQEVCALVGGHSITRQRSLCHLFEQHGVKFVAADFARLLENPPGTTHCAWQRHLDEFELLVSLRHLRSASDNQLRNGLASLTVVADFATALKSPILWGPNGSIILGELLVGWQWKDGKDLVHVHISVLKGHAGRHRDTFGGKRPGERARQKAALARFEPKWLRNGCQEGL